MVEVKVVDLIINDIFAYIEKPVFNEPLSNTVTFKSNSTNLDFIDTYTVEWYLYDETKGNMNNGEAWTELEYNTELIPGRIYSSDIYFNLKNDFALDENVTGKINDLDHVNDMGMVYTNKKEGFLSLIYEPLSNHTHNYGTSYKFNNDVHYLECDCGKIKNEALHEYTNKRSTECLVCGAVREVEFPEYEDKLNIIGLKNGAKIEDLVFYFEYSELDLYSYDIKAYSGFDVNTKECINELEFDTVIEEGVDYYFLIEVDDKDFELEEVSYVGEVLKVEKFEYSSYITVKANTNTCTENQTKATGNIYISDIELPTPSKMANISSIKLNNPCYFISEYFWVVKIDGEYCGEYEVNGKYYYVDEIEFLEGYEYALFLTIETTPHYSYDENPFVYFGSNKLELLSSDSPMDKSGYFVYPNGIFDAFIIPTDYNEIKTPKVIDTISSIWDKNSNEDFVVKTDGDYSLFEDLYLDDVLVDISNYVVEEGSTIVKLKKEYLDTLSLGSHKLTIKTGYHECIFNFRIENHIHAYDQKNTIDLYKKSDATCTNKATYYYSCLCGEKGTDTFEDKDALGHDLTSITYTWSEDNKTCVARGVCLRNAEHIIEETVNTTFEVIQQQSCKVEELTKFKATFTNPQFVTQTKEVKTKDLAEHVFENDQDKDCNICGFERDVTPIIVKDESPISTGLIITIVIICVVSLGIGGFSLYWFVISKKTINDLIKIFKKEK